MKFINLIFLAILLASCKPKVCSDPVACKVVDSNLTIINKYVYEKIAPPTSCVSTVHFFVVLTRIGSESPTDDLGQPGPTQNDYKRWSSWYEDNKDKLYWDKKSQKVLLRK